jgi:hypothetical protein
MMLLALAAWLSPVLAQEVEVTSLSRLLEGVEGPAYYPVLNSAGDRLLFSTENGALKLYDFTDNVTTTVTRDFVAGNDACFGGDGKVYFVTQQSGENHLVYRTGQCYDAASRAVTRLTESHHGTVKAVATTRGGMVKALGKADRDMTSSGSGAWTEGNRVHVIVDGKERVFSPVDSWAGYLWASLSPDGQRVAFFAAGKGIVVIDLRGQVVAMLGNYEMPCWYDNDYLVAQHATDDGHQFTSSQIMLLKADGTWQAQLNSPESMAMHPTCGGGKIVYTTIDGLLYEMHINIYR